MRYTDERIQNILNRLYDARYQCAEMCQDIRCDQKLKISEVARSIYGLSELIDQIKVLELQVRENKTRYVPDVYAGDGSDPSVFVYLHANGIRRK